MIFSCYSCFNFIRDDERRLGFEPPLPAGPLAVAFIATALAWRLPEPYFMIGMLSSLFLVPVQQHVNRINAVAAPDHDKNSRFSAWNWLVVVVGGIFIGLILIGLAQPGRTHAQSVRVAAAAAPGGGTADSG